MGLWIEPGIANTSRPWSAACRAVISEPLLDWERLGYKVNEGAAVIVRNGKVFLSYSASATDHNYAMGLLTADVDANGSNSADAASGTSIACRQCGHGTCRPARVDGARKLRPHTHCTTALIASPVMTSLLRRCENWTKRGNEPRQTAQQRPR